MNMRSNPVIREKIDGTRAQTIVMTAAQVTRVYAAASVAEMSQNDALALIEGGGTIEMALDEITAFWKEGGELDFPMMGAPTARIGSDEGTTIREGMTGALAARMSGAWEVSGPARQYMGKTFPEMAATFLGSRNPIRTAGERVRAIEMSMNTTSNYPSIFENAMLRAVTGALPSVAISGLILSSAWVVSRRSSAWGSVAKSSTAPRPKAKRPLL